MLDTTHTSMPVVTATIKPVNGKFEPISDPVSMGVLIEELQELGDNAYFLTLISPVPMGLINVTITHGLRPMNFKYGVFKLNGDESNPMGKGVGLWTPRLVYREYGVQTFQIDRTNVNNPTDKDMGKLMVALSPSAEKTERAKEFRESTGHNVSNRFLIELTEFVVDTPPPDENTRGITKGGFMGDSQPRTRGFSGGFRGGSPPRTRSIFGGASDSVTRSYQPSGRRLQGGAIVNGSSAGAIHTNSSVTGHLGGVKMRIYTQLKFDIDTSDRIGVDEVDPDAFTNLHKRMKADDTDEEDIETSGADEKQSME